MKRFTTLCCAFFLLFTLSADAGAPRSADEVSCVYADGGVRLTVSVPRHVDLGAPIPVSIVLENGSDGGIAWIRAGQPFFMSLKNSNDKEVSKTGAGKSEMAGDVDSGFTSLNPGEKIKRSYDFAHWYKVEHDGLYEISVSQTFHGPGKGDDWSDVRANVSVRIGKVSNPTMDQGKKRGHH